MTMLLVERTFVRLFLVNGHSIKNLEMATRAGLKTHEKTFDRKHKTNDLTVINWHFENDVFQSRPR